MATLIERLRNPDYKASSTYMLTREAADEIERRMAMVDYLKEVDATQCRHIEQLEFENSGLRAANSRLLEQLCARPKVKSLRARLEAWLFYPDDRAAP
jgi:ferritin